VSVTVVTESLAQGYALRPAGKDDAPGIHTIIVASDTADWGEASGYSLGEVEDTLNEVDPATDTWIVTSPSGEIAGYAYIHDRSHVRMDVEGYVHPGHSGRGIGTALVRASGARAREHVPMAAHGARVVVQNWINADNANARALLEREGYTPFRYFLRMESALDGTSPTPEWPNGMTVRTCEAEPDQRLMYETMEEAMADHWGFIPRTFDEWMGRKKGSTWDPTLWFLALAGDEPIGGAVRSVSEGVGWVDNLGVRATGRKRGLGMALLRQAAREFSRRGLEKMALGVDSESPTGATRLYERAGMHVAQRHATYGKVLRDGEDLGRGA
jgi:mycothiol synthase